MEITKSFTPSNLADWRNWLAKITTVSGKSGLSISKLIKANRTLIMKALLKKPYVSAGLTASSKRSTRKNPPRKFNPRRMSSIWSETNKRRVVKAIREGRMTEAGMAKVTFDMNKVDISKPKPKRPPVKMPEKIEKALKFRPDVWEAFQKITPSLQRNYILWLSDAKNQRPLSGGCKSWLTK